VGIQGGLKNENLKKTTEGEGGEERSAKVLRYWGPLSHLLKRTKGGVSWGGKSWD